MTDQVEPITAGWHHWPATVSQLAVLARGIVDLERAGLTEDGGVVPVDLDGLRAVVQLIDNGRRR